MAELGVIASVVQIADTGLRLSIKLCTFGEIVASADRSVLYISKDVSLASSVLKELSAVLAKDTEIKFLTNTAIGTTEDVVKECLQVFEEMEEMIIKRLPNLREPGREKASKATVLLERLRWPYLQPKLQLLQSNLDRLKSTVLLMLNVVSYARQISMKSEPDHIIANQRSLIEDLAQSNQDYIRRFESLKLESQTQSIQPNNSDRNVHGTSLKGVQPNLNFFVQGKSDSNSQGFISDYGNLFEGYTDFAGDERFTQLQHYLNMLTAILKEVDLVKYCIDMVRRSRVRNAIHDIFDLEIDSLTRPFGEDCLRLVKNHFASLIEASRNKFNTSKMQNTSVPTRFCPSRSVSPDQISRYSQESPTYSYALPEPIQEVNACEDEPSPKPQCWDHGCNGRQFTTYSNLLRHTLEHPGNTPLRHQRERPGSTNSVCPRCGAEFTRKTARDAHLAHDKCKEKLVVAGPQERSAVIVNNEMSQKQSPSPRHRRRSSHGYDFHYSDADDWERHRRRRRTIPRKQKLPEKKEEDQAAQERWEEEQIMKVAPRETKVAPMVMEGEEELGALFPTISSGRTGRFPRCSAFGSKADELVALWTLPGIGGSGGHDSGNGNSLSR